MRVLVSGTPRYSALRSLVHSLLMLCELAVLHHPLLVNLLVLWIQVLYARVSLIIQLVHCLRLVYRFLFLGRVRSVSEVVLRNILVVSNRSMPSALSVVPRILIETVHHRRSGCRLFLQSLLVQICKFSLLLLHLLLIVVDLHIDVVHPQAHVVFARLSVISLVQWASISQIQQIFHFVVWKTFVRSFHLHLWASFLLSNLHDVLLIVLLHVVDCVAWILVLIVGPIETLRLLAFESVKMRVTLLHLELNLFFSICSEIWRWWLLLHNL